MNNVNLSTDEFVLPVKWTEDEALEARMTGNACNDTLPACCLHKDTDGDLVEVQENLFPRITRNIMFAEAVFEAEERDIELTVAPDLVKLGHPRHDELAAGVLGKGVMADGDETGMTLSVYNVNKFAYDTLVPELPEEVREVVIEKHETLEELMEQLPFISNSPTLMNVGGELQQLSVCFVNSPADDVMDIHQTARETAEVLQPGDSMGYAFWKLRPYGDAIGSTDGIAPGLITSMRMFDQMCGTVAQGDTHRGAQMGVMRVSHPDVIQFLHAKNKDVSLAHTFRLNDLGDFTHTEFTDALDEAREPTDESGRIPKYFRNAVEGYLLNFNTSVGITNSFMKALYNDEGSVFMSSRTEGPHVATPQTKEIYDMFGLGECVKAGEVLLVPAKELWDQIIEGAWENGEPGIVYLEHANKEHSFDVEKHPDHQVLAANPCGKQPLEEYEACNLSHINLSTLVAEGSSDWHVWYDAHSGECDSLEAATKTFLEDTIDWEELNHCIENGTRFLENVVTISGFPVEKIEEKIRELCKIGLGIMGLTQLYIQLGTRYGSDEDNEIAQQLMIHINYGPKQASHELTGERGSFEAWEDLKYTNPTEYREQFEHHTGEDADDWGDGYPIHSHNTTVVAPTDITSMVSNTTGDCESIYNVAYYKNVSDDVQDDEMLIGFDNYFLRVLEANDIGVEVAKRETQEQTVSNQFDGLSSLSTVPDAISKLFVVASDLAGTEHADVQCALQSGVDSTISKTCNFPNSASKENMDEVYHYIYDHDGKGVAVYRDGARSKQALTICVKNTEFSDDEEAVEAIISQIRDVFGNAEALLDSEEVSGLIGSEFELAFADSPSDVGKKCPHPDVLCGVTRCIDIGYGKLYASINGDEHGEPPELFANAGNSGGFTASFTEAFTKTVPTSFRPGVGPEEITNELKGIRDPRATWDKGEQINSIPDAIGTAMRRYLDGDIDKGYPQQQNLIEVEVKTATVEDANADIDGDVAVDDGPDNDAVADLLAADESLECPECDEVDLYYPEGCKTCQNYGQSER